MTVAITAAIIAALKANTALVALLGGQYVYPRSRAAVQQIPGIYLTTNTEGRKRRPGYNVDKKRDNAPILQVDVFHTTTAAAVDAIAEAVDAALFGTGVAGTRGWSGVSRSEQYEEDLGRHHVALRYSFAYTLTDA
jgi:hypothetical protein